MTEIPKEVEEAARAIAHWHGQKMKYRSPDGVMLTVASARDGYTGRHDGIDRYVDGHWQEYKAAAEWHLMEIEKAMATAKNTA